MKKAVRPFRSILDEDQQRESMEIALIRCLRNHKPSQQKFTTSLYRFTKWECQNAARSIKRRDRVKLYFTDAVPDLPSADRDQFNHMYDCMDQLTESERTAIRRYYLDEHTLDEIGGMCGYSRQAAHINLKKAVDKLKRLCLE